MVYSYTTTGVSRFRLEFATQRLTSMTYDVNILAGRTLIYQFGSESSHAVTKHNNRKIIL